MDVYCTRCGEPWDVFCLSTPKGHDLEIRNGKILKCGCCPKDPADIPAGNRRVAELAEVAADLLGDDIDGQAAMLEDAELLGMFGD